MEIKVNTLFCFLLPFILNADLFPILKVRLTIYKEAEGEGINLIMSQLGKDYLISF